MKKILGILTIATIAAFASNQITNYYNNKALEQRIFAQYGEGDAGLEMLSYLKTGILIDFMGNPYTIDTNTAELRAAFQFIETSIKMQPGFAYSLEIYPGETPEIISYPLDKFSIVNK